MLKWFILLKRKLRIRKRNDLYEQDTRFPLSLDFKNTDFKLHPELYRIGVGEQGVPLVEPYKSENNLKKL
jgi:hypothetical protein